MFAQVRAVKCALARGACDDRGFTLVELLMSAAIMLVVAMGTMYALAFAASSTRASSVRDAALDVANKQLEYARNLPYDSLGTVAGDPPGVIVTPDSATTPQATFNLVTEASWIRDISTGRAKFKRVRATVSWTTGTPGQVSLSTDVFGKSDLVNSGDLLIKTLRKDDNVPLQNSSVTIQPSSGSARTVYTDAAGEAFFGFVPAGSVTIAIANGSYLFDPAQFTGSSITADLLNSIVAYGQIPSSAVIHVVGNPSGGNIAGANVRLADASSRYLYGTTDSDGLVRFDNLLIGSYLIRASATGRATVDNITLSITAGGQTLSQTVPMNDVSDVVIQVQDGAGGKLSGATVSMTGPSGPVAGSPAVTPASGDAPFTGLAEGTYTVTVTKSGFGTATRTVTVPVATNPVIVTLSPNGPGSLLVTVKDASGNLRSGVRVRLTYPDGTVSPSGSTRYTTDANGQFTWTGLDAGTGYKFEWRDSGRNWHTGWTGTISSGQTSTPIINDYH